MCESSVSGNQEIDLTGCQRFVEKVIRLEELVPFRVSTDLEPEPWGKLDTDIGRGSVYSSSIFLDANFKLDSEGAELQIGITIDNTRRLENGAINVVTACQALVSHSLLDPTGRRYSDDTIHQVRASSKGIAPFFTKHLWSTDPSFRTDSKPRSILSGEQAAKAFAALLSGKLTGKLDRDPEASERLLKDLERWADAGAFQDALNEPEDVFTAARLIAIMAKLDLCGPDNYIEPTL